MAEERVIDGLTKKEAHALLQNANMLLGDAQWNHSIWQVRLDAARANIRILQRILEKFEKAKK